MLCSPSILPAIPNLGGIGDSLTFGDMATTTVLIQVALLSNGSRYRTRNFSHNGWGTTLMIADYPLSVRPVFNFTTTQTPWWCSVESAFNDINLGLNASQLYTNLCTLYSLVRGDLGKAIATLLPTPTNFDTDKTATLNSVKSMLLGDPTPYDAIVDISDIDLSNPVNSPDGVHLTDAAITNIWAPRMNAVLP